MSQILSFCFRYRAEAHSKCLQDTEWMLHLKREEVVIDLSKLHVNGIVILFVDQGEVLFAGYLDSTTDDTLGIAHGFIT